MIWTVLVVLAAVNAALKAIGPAVLGGRPLPPRAAAVFALLAPALLTALVVTQVGSGERAVGVAVAGVAVLARVPLVLALVLGAATAALLRV